MSTRAERPDIGQVLGGLKDFQRRTVDYVFRRMYLDDQPTRRFLVADEVGLGKTLVAKGLAALAIDHLWDTVDRIDVLYICSNGAIARQNVNRLNLTTSQFSLASRITLLPVELAELENRKLNFISFTPGTSFDLRSSLGRLKERVLIHRLLEHAWGVAGVRPLNALQGNAGRERFRQAIRNFDDSDVNQALADAYREALDSEHRRACAGGKEGIRDRWERLCENFARAKRRENRATEAISLQREVIGELRDILAHTCLKALEPDLIILDEFQRFKHLLDEEDEASRLAQELFRYQDAVSQARVLLLSATPYKMLTTREEADGEDHYADFIATLRFLQDDPSTTERAQRLVREYRRALLRLGAHGGGEGEEVTRIQQEMERGLRSVMVRTERLAVTPDRDGMLRLVQSQSMGLTPPEALSYRALGQIADHLENGDPIEYWKSAPYLLSFMENYELKEDFAEAVEEGDGIRELAASIQQDLPLVLPWKDVEGYRRLDAGNARLRYLEEHLTHSGAWSLLWVAPARPWYRLEGAYADDRAKQFTKLLIFSAWQVVPKVISSLVSYEAERSLLIADDPAARNSAGGRRAFTPLLRFVSEGSGSLLALIYPSVVLARIATTVERKLSGKVPTLQSVRDEIRGRIEELLQEFPAPSGPETDEQWYWVTPAMLDAAEDPFGTVEWLEDPATAQEWLGMAGEELLEEGDRVFQRVQLPGLIRILREGGRNLGPRPADLAEVLTDIALGSPAIAALRALMAVCGEPEPSPSMRSAAGMIGWAFRSYLNLPEVTALIRKGNRETAYWREVLRYTIQGGLDAVMEEYVHMLKDWLSVGQLPPDEMAGVLADTMAEALQIRTANLRADEIAVDRSKSSISIASRRMRSRFAARLGEDEEEGGTDRTRVDQIRTAFNSPFWPFVLASTSIGQEGLDFHLYCHAVVHWNLPTNPVDLEQREGRVHRFKGHAVRKNVALAHGDAVPQDSPDAWHAMFEAARLARPPEASDLWPYWVYPVQDGAKIQRHVPVLPLSRDQGRFERLRKALAVYRMVFGQPRQEELMAYLLARIPAGQVEEVSARLRIDLSPPVHSGYA